MTKEEELRKFLKEARADSFGADYWGFTMAVADCLGLTKTDGEAVEIHVHVDELLEMSEDAGLAKEVVRLRRLLARCEEGFEAVRAANLDRAHAAADEMLALLRTGKEP